MTVKKRLTKTKVAVLTAALVALLGGSVSVKIQEFIQVLASVL